MDLYCLGMTMIPVALSIGWIMLWERASTPVPWRMAVSAAGAGLVAFTAQSVFCPGVDWFHLIVGHGGAGIGSAALIGLWWLYRSNKSGPS